MTIKEAKSNFSNLIDSVLNGEEVIIEKNGIPVAQLTPFKTDVTPRKGGQFKGLINVAEDFDAELPKNLINQFYKKDA